MCVYLIAADPPTGLMAVEDSPTSILVSWTAPASGSAIVTGYRIFYQTGGDSEESANASVDATSHTLTGLQSGATYSISIVALSSTLPSTVVGPETVTLPTPPPPPVTVSVDITAPGTGFAGEMYSLTCTATVVGTMATPSFLWLDQGGTVMSGPGITIDVAPPDSSTLMFSPLSAAHAGNYTCQVSVGDATESASMVFTVRGITPAYMCIRGNCVCLE